MYFSVVTIAFIQTVILTHQYSVADSINVTVPVSITDGGDLLLSCFFGNNTTWSERGVTINKNNSVHNIDGQLRLKVLNVSNSSVFKCQRIHQNLTSNSSQVESVTFDINLIDKPVHKVKEGENTTLSCPGNLTNVTWNENQMTQLHRLTDVNRNNRLFKCSGKVQGSYSQAVVNQTVMLDVQYPADNITIRLTQGSDRLNATLKIVCQALNGNPIPQFFIWSKDGKSIANNTGTFTKVSLQYTDNGVYSCLPENAKQEHKKSLTVVIKGPPSAPKDVTQNKTARSKTSYGILWKAPEYNGNATISVYEVSVTRSDKTDGESRFYNTTSFSYTAKDLKPDTRYRFRVRAFNSFGSGDWSEGLVDTTVPDAKVPTGLKVQRVNFTNEIKITWMKPDKDKKYFYMLCYRKTDESNSKECCNTTDLKIEKTLDANKEYSFDVRACDETNKGVCSDYTKSTKIITGREVPEAPNISTSPGPNYVNVTLQLNAIYNYTRVKLKQENKPQWQDVEDQHATTFQIPKLEPNTSYNLELYAVVFTSDDKKEVRGKVASRTFQTVIDPTGPSPTSTPLPPENDPSRLKSVLIAVAVLAVIAAIVAATFLFLYLRTTHLRLRFTRSPGDAFTLDNVGDGSLSSPRERLTSFTLSLKKQAICKSDSIQVKAFPGHVARLHSDSDYLFSLEYEVVGSKKYLDEKDKKVELTSIEGKKPENKSKNRYSDILPYDHCRVVLTKLEDDPDSCYINASYIDGYRKQRAYIAAQGPLASTLCDFWRMIWESNTCVVVMITNLFEKGRSKCVKYWPDKDYADYGLIRVTAVEEESFANYVVRTFSIEPVPDQTHYIMVNGKAESRIIQQFHYTEWPDHGVPVHPAAILRYVRKSKAASPPGAGPIVVHCSAGVGRSGSYIVIDSMLERIEDDKTVDIFNFLNHIRTQRNYLVQEESQYIFVHDALLEHISFGDSNIPMKDFPDHVKSLREVDPASNQTGIQREFEDIDHTKHLEKHKWAAKKACNTLKNRREDILPVERTRVKLPLVLGMEGSDYINASYIDGFTRKKEYIATQAPMRKTAECFWRMICAAKCKIIVMLLDADEWKKDDYFADLPTAEEPVLCGRFEIQLESEVVSQRVTIRKLRVFSSDTSDGRSVSLYHYQNWPANGFPDDKASLTSFIEQVRNHKMADTENAPVTVYCDFGIGRTGVFCLLSTLYDQLEKEEHLDVYQTAKLYRVQRPKLIETEEQYAFCYDILEHLVSKKLRPAVKEPETNSVLSGPDTLAIVHNPNASGGVNPVVDDANSDSSLG